MANKLSFTRTHTFVQFLGHNQWLLASIYRKPCEDPTIQTSCPFIPFLLSPLIFSPPLLEINDEYWQVVLVLVIVVCTLRLSDLSCGHCTAGSGHDDDQAAGGQSTSVVEGAAEAGR